MIFAPYCEVLSIPEAVMPAYLCIKTIAYILFPLMFALHVLDKLTGAIHSPGGDNEINWYKTIFRAILVFVALAWYRHIFMKILALCEAIGMSLCDMSKFSSLIDFITTQSYSYIKGTVGDSATGKVLGGINATLAILQPKILILSILYILVGIIESIFLSVRYLLLAILYVFGPFAIVLNLFRYTKVILKGWLVAVFQISAWIIILRILQATMVSLQIENWAYQQGQTMKDMLPWITVCLIYVALVVLVPMITAKIISGENLGEIGSLAIGAATMLVTRYSAPAIKTGNTAVKGISKTYSNVKDRVSGWRGRGSSSKDTEHKEQPRR
ncbi:MAG: hypothetical protein PHE88_11965 [Elusimicrobia bacterium]|nr:hypothetical protein [Elusimicrobiota bacterium]